MAKKKKSNNLDSFYAVVFFIFLSVLVWLWNNYKISFIFGAILITGISIYLILKRKKSRRQKILLEENPFIELSITTSKENYFVKPKLIEHKSLYTDYKEMWDIGDNVRNIRNSKGMTQKHLSELMGYKSTSFISRLEYGDNAKITHEQVERLAHALSVDINEILTGYERIDNNTDGL